MIIIPFLNGYFIGNINPTFSDKPTFLLVNPPKCFWLKSIWTPQSFRKPSRRPTSMACAAVSSKPTFAWASAWWAASPSAWSWPRPSPSVAGGADFWAELKQIIFAHGWGFSWGFALQGFHGMIRMNLGLSETWIDQQNVVQRSTIWILICQFIWNIIYPDMGWFHSTWRWYLWISLYWGFGDVNFNHQADDSATVRTVHQSPNSAHNLLIQIQKPLDA